MPTLRLLIQTLNTDSPYTFVPHFFCFGSVALSFVCITSHFPKMRKTKNVHKLPFYPVQNQWSMMCIVCLLKKQKQTPNVLLLSFWNRYLLSWLLYAKVVYSSIQSWPSVCSHWRTQASSSAKLPQLYSKSVYMGGLWRIRAQPAHTPVPRTQTVPDSGCSQPDWQDFWPIPTNAAAHQLGAG